MADLFVSFVRKRPQGKELGNSADSLASWKSTRGGGVRSLRMLIGAQSTMTTIGASAREDAVILRAGAACWVAVGGAPVAEVGLDASPEVAVGSHYMLQNETLELAVNLGDKVAVIAAA